MLALAPQVEPASFISKLFRFFSLPAVFVKCSLWWTDCKRQTKSEPHTQRRYKQSLCATEGPRCRWLDNSECTWSMDKSLVHTLTADCLFTNVFIALVSCQYLQCCKSCVATLFGLSPLRLDAEEYRYHRALQNCNQRHIMVTPLSSWQTLLSAATNGQVPDPVIRKRQDASFGWGQIMQLIPVQIIFDFQQHASIGDR